MRPDCGPVAELEAGGVPEARERHHVETLRSRARRSTRRSRAACRRGGSQRRRRVARPARGGAARDPGPDRVSTTLTAPRGTATIAISDDHDAGDRRAIARAIPPTRKPIASSRTPRRERSACDRAAPARRCPSRRRAARARTNSSTSTRPSDDRVATRRLRRRRRPSRTMARAAAGRRRRVARRCAPCRRRSCAGSSRNGHLAPGRGTTVPTAATIRAHRPRSRPASARPPGRAESRGPRTRPAASRNPETCVRRVRNTSTPTTGACQRRGRRSQPSESTAATTPSSSSSAYMRAVRP